MAIKLGDAFVAIGTKDELDKGLNAAEAKVNGWLSNLGAGIAQGIGQAVFNTVSRTISTAIAEIGKSVQAAGELNETLSRVSAVFGESAQDITAWSQTTSRAFGLAQSDALAAAGSLGNMFTQLGFGAEQAATFSQALIETAGDLTAFHNVSGGVEEVLNAMQSAFRGELTPYSVISP